MTKNEAGLLRRESSRIEQFLVIQKENKERNKWFFFVGTTIQKNEWFVLAVLKSSLYQGNCGGLRSSSAWQIHKDRISDSGDHAYQDDNGVWVWGLP